ncbi:MAG: gliding motility protein GldL [Bacteroidales bacterium]
MENSNKKKRRGLSKLLSTPKGQIFMNMAYSLGAAIVILGAMFKILHLNFGTEMLMLGMTMEVIIFTLSAFDRSDEDKAMAMDWSRVFPILKTGLKEDNPLNNIAENGIKVTGGSFSSELKLEGMPSLSAEQSAAFADSIAKFNDAAVGFAKMAELTDRMHNSSSSYVDNMSTLNRNIEGLGRAYSEQLESMASQLRAISIAQEEVSRMQRIFEGSADSSDRFRRETERLADQLAQLNAIYSRMIHAMAPSSTGGNRPIY